MLTGDDIAARTDRAVTAACDAGRDIGLQVEEPRVLHDAFSVLVHLAPAPVVVRVPTVLPPAVLDDPEVQTAQQRAELAVTGWLADRGHPVVAPFLREPVRRHGFSMTLWHHVDEAADQPADWPQRFAGTAHLHAALRDCDAARLGFCAPFATYIPGGLSALERHPELLAPADLDRARRQWAAIAPVLTSQAAFEAAYPGVAVQPVHGDAPYYNMIATAKGLCWSDFEMVALGPVETDLALAGPDAVTAYDAAATRLGLRPLDRRVLALCESAGRLAAVAALALAPQLPMLVDALRPTVEEWRSTT